MKREPLTSTLAVPEVGHMQVAVACLALAVIGRIFAQFIPNAPATDPHLVINWNPFTEIEMSGLPRTSIS